MNYLPGITPLRTGEPKTRLGFGVALSPAYEAVTIQHEDRSDEIIEITPVEIRYRIYCGDSFVPIIDRVITRQDAATNLMVVTTEMPLEGLLTAG